MLTPQDFADRLGSALARLQLLAEARMTERFIIERPGRPKVGEDGRETTPYTVIYEGIGRLRSFRPYEQNADVAGSTATVQRVDWHIPAPERMDALQAEGKVATWAGPVQAGDRARRVTPGKAEKSTRIAGEHDITDQTAQRLVADDITGGVWA